MQVILDCDNRQLSFSKNGVSQGRAFTDLPANVQFVGAVSLYDALDSMKVLGYARLDDGDASAMWSSDGGLAPTSANAGTAPSHSCAYVFLLQWTSRYDHLVQSLQAHLGVLLLLKRSREVPFTAFCKTPSRVTAHWYDIFITHVQFDNKSSLCSLSLRIMIFSLHSLWFPDTNANL